MFGGDPFGNMFGDIHHQMRRQMRDMDRMMESMMDPFGMFSRHSMYAGMLDDGVPRQQRAPPRDDMALMNPFGFGGGGLFGGIMRHMEDLQANAVNDPNSHVFSHSTMITFDGRNGGQPRIVEKSIRKTGEVKETRESLRRGDVGERMSIEHTIGDRTHVIEKKRDRDGRIREEQHFVNLDQEEAEDFDREFVTRVRHNFGGASGDQSRSHYAIEAGPRTTTTRPNTQNYSANSKSGRSSGNKGRGGGGGGGDSGSATAAAAAPVITLPDDEYDNDTDSSMGASQSHSSRKHGGSGSRSRSTGPIIREISEEEAEMSVPKRRKGLVGPIIATAETGDASSSNLKNNDGKRNNNNNNNNSQNCPLPN